MTLKSTTTQELKEYLCLFCDEQFFAAGSQPACPKCGHAETTWVAPAYVAGEDDEEEGSATVSLDPDLP